MIWTYELNPDMTNMEQLCDGEDQMRNTDPRFLYGENDPNRQASVENNINIYEGYVEFLAEKQYWYISNRVEGTRFFDHFWMGRCFTGAAVYYFTSLFHMKEHCKEIYPNGSPHGNGTAAFYDHCALAHNNHRGNPESSMHEIYFDYSNMQWSLDFRQSLDNIGDLIMLIGVVSYFAGYKVKS